MSAPVKAAHGERQRQALEAIAKFEKAQQLWGSGELAKELDCSPAQAHQLIQALAAAEKLKRGTRTVVVHEAFVLAA